MSELYIFYISLSLILNSLLCFGTPSDSFLFPSKHSIILTVLNTNVNNSSYVNYNQKIKVDNKTFELLNKSINVGIQTKGLKMNIADFFPTNIQDFKNEFPKKEKFYSSQSIRKEISDRRQHSYQNNITFKQFLTSRVFDGNEKKVSRFNKSGIKIRKEDESVSQLGEKIAFLQCDLQNVSSDATLWSGNSTHEIILPRKGKVSNLIYLSIKICSHT